MEKKRKVAVIVGSTSDVPKIRDGINALRIADRQGLIDWVGNAVCSAHRNPEQLREVVREYVGMGVDVIIACAGKFAALFGSIDAQLRNELKVSTPRVVAVPLKGKTEEESLAALAGATQTVDLQLLFDRSFFDNPAKAFEFAIGGGISPARIVEQKPAETLSPATMYELARIKHPGVASYDTEIQVLEALGFFHLSSGKTREIFINPEFPRGLYILATDRISIFDIVLDARIPRKGEVLTAMTIFWLHRVFAADVPNHLVAFGSEIRPYLPEPFMNSTFTPMTEYLMRNMIVVDRCDVLPVEAIVRGNLTGSGYKDYQKTGVVCGIPLPGGLVDGSALPEVIFTPSTKAPLGEHDENIPFERMSELIGKERAEFVRTKSIELFAKAGGIAKAAGMIIADTKFEFGVDPEGGICLIDEVLTPDSSRYWPEDEWLDAIGEGKTPPSLDKQPVRDAGAAADVKNHPEWVPPHELVAQTTDRYLEGLTRLVGQSLETFQRDVMLIE